MDFWLWYVLGLAGLGCGYLLSFVKRMALNRQFMADWINRDAEQVVKQAGPIQDELYLMARIEEAQAAYWVFTSENNATLAEFARNRIKIMQETLACLREMPDSFTDK
jgi:hypothetical protein